MCIVGRPLTCPRSTTMLVVSTLSPLRLPPMTGKHPLVSSRCFITIIRLGLLRHYGLTRPPAVLTISVLRSVQLLFPFMWTILEAARFLLLAIPSTMCVGVLPWHPRS